MKAAELRDLPVEELDRRASEMRENIFNLRIRHAAGTLDSSADLSKHKRDLARVLTVLNEKKRAAGGQPAGAAKHQATAPKEQAPAPAPEKGLR
jgi:large subunit ribosomal protein L29